MYVIIIFSPMIMILSLFLFFYCNELDGKKMFGNLFVIQKDIHVHKMYTKI